MQVNTVNNVSFGAKIIPSKALDSALELAQNEAYKGTKEGLKRSAEFYNYLRTIENDATADNFFVDANPAFFYPYMQLGKSKRLLEFFGSSGKDIAHSIQNGVKKLVEGKYLRSEIVDEAKDVDLTNAFSRWILTNKTNI